MSKEEKPEKKIKKVKLKFHGSHFTFDDASGHREVRNEGVFEVDKEVSKRDSFKFMLEKEALEIVR